MNYFYIVKCGRYDYAHTMFITSDLSAANRFIENYNKMFSVDKWDDYVEYRAYIEIMPDYVPELNKDYYTCNTTVYSVPANKDMQIDASEIRGYPISDYIDFTANANEIYGNDDREHIILDELLKNGYSAFETRNGYCILIVVVDKGMKPCHDIVFNDWISDDLKQNLVYKAKELLSNLT